MNFKNFVVLYFSNVLGYYFPAIWLTWLRGQKLSTIEKLVPSILHTFINLHVLLPVQVWVLLWIYRPAEVFNPWRESLCLILCFILGEVWFYGVHRIFHKPYLFAKVHRLHHLIRKPHAIHSGFQHPLEFLIPTMGTCFVGPILLGCHNFTTFVWLFLMMAAGTIGHGGYFPKFLSQFKGHDKHHRYLNQNYGFAFMDILFGTTGKNRRTSSM